MHDSLFTPLEFPSNLAYAPDSLAVPVDTVGKSVLPTPTGTSAFTFNIGTSPSTNGKITIDNQGYINTDSKLAAEKYSISVIVTNKVGSAIFPNIYTILVNEMLPVSFASDINPLITGHCAPCHTAGPETIYTNYTNASENINLILDRVQRKPGTAGFMPKSGTALSDSQIQLLKDWLVQGLPQ